MSNGVPKAGTGSIRHSAYKTNSDKYKEANQNAIDKGMISRPNNMPGMDEYMSVMGREWEKQQEGKKKTPEEKKFLKAWDASKKSNDNFDKLYNMEPGSTDKSPSVDGDKPKGDDELSQILGKHARYGVATADSPNVIPAAYMGINHTNKMGKPLSAIDLSKMTPKEKEVVFKRMPADKRQMWIQRNQKNLEQQEALDKEYINNRVQGFFAEYHYRKKNGMEIPEKWDSIYESLQKKTINELYELTQEEEGDE